MRLRNPTTVGGKTEAKSTGRKSDSQTTPLVRPTFATLRPFLDLAHLARCAAAILALLLADIFRRLRIGLPPP